MVWDKSTCASMFGRSTEGESFFNITRRILLLGQKEIVFSRKTLLMPKIFIWVSQCVLSWKYDEQCTIVQCLNVRNNTVPSNTLRINFIVCKCSPCFNASAGYLQLYLDTMFRSSKWSLKRCKVATVSRRLAPAIPKRLPE